MTYIPALEVQYIDNATIDAFGRARFSNPYTIFDSKQIVDKQSLFWDESITGAGAASTHNANQASTTLSVANATVSTVIRQTKRRFNYQPSKSHLIFMTGVLGAGATGITRRIGYFDGNNGLFFQLSGTTLSVVRRTNVTGTPVDTVTTQSNWNIDKLDGTGRSKFTINTSLPQIFFVDFEWLGVGRVRYGFVINGQIVICHESYHANVLGITTVYMSSPNLPLRYEISNSGAGGAASLVHICSSVISEGGMEQNGPNFSVDRSSTAYVTGNNTSLHPLLSIRLKSNYSFATVQPMAISILEGGSNNLFRFGLIMNPTIAGLDNASWLSISNSAIEYDVSRNNTNTLTGGTILYSQYAISRSDVASQLQTTLLLGTTIAGVSDQLVVFGQSIASSQSLYASLNWHEHQ